ncbi:thermonuclease family protein [Pseudonocardia spinosispora]|uniref:thermonuclease family protein n=1 Tax=Pseudonocardia spinosispora TaxID=103441 RepID=UPI000406695E|nr:hypothetical protein [Pseudonocardia spinosispora]
MLLGVSLSGCAGDPPPLTAEQVTQQLAAQVKTSTLTRVYTAESDPNKLLGRPGGYLSKTAFTDSRAETSSSGALPDAITNGGSVEVFADEEGATTRRDYLQGIGKRAPILGEYDYQNGAVLLRVSRNLTPQQAAEYEAALPLATKPGPPPPPTTAVSTTSPTKMAQPADPSAVSVASVHDAATVVLTNGVRLRQAGISAPNSNTCAAKESAVVTDAEVRRAQLSYQLLGQSDLYGNQWAYLQVGGADLGERLASLGWVWAYPDSPASQSYSQRIARQVDAARSSKIGLFGTTCPDSIPPTTGQQLTPPAKAISDGTYVVGTDIEAGTYRTAGPDETALIKMCSWSRRKDTSGEIGSVIATNIAQGPTTVTIKPTDRAFESRGCTPWNRLN